MIIDHTEFEFIQGNNKNKTCESIISALRRGDLREARFIYVNDGDKIPAYQDWGRVFRRNLEYLIGCRIHGEVNCTKPFCQTLK